MNVWYFSHSLGCQNKYHKGLCCCSFSNEYVLVVQPTPLLVLVFALLNFGPILLTNGRGDPDSNIFLKAQSLTEKCSFLSESKVLLVNSFICLHSQLLWSRKILCDYCICTTLIPWYKPGIFWSITESVVFGCWIHYFVVFHIRSPSQERDEAHFSHSAPEIRDVFGDSDDEEPVEYGVQNQIEDETNVCIRC